MTIEEKMSIARGIVTPLLRKIGAGKYEWSDRTVCWMKRKKIESLSAHWSLFNNPPPLG